MIQPILQTLWNAWRVLLPLMRNLPTLCDFLITIRTACFHSSASSPGKQYPSMQGKDFPGRSMPFSSHRRKRTPSLLPGDLIPTDVSRHIPSSSGMRIRRKERNISRISTVPAGGAMPFQVRTTPMPITARKGSSSRGEKQKTLLFFE